MRPIRPHGIIPPVQERKIWNHSAFLSVIRLVVCLLRPIEAMISIVLCRRVSVPVASAIANASFAELQISEIPERKNIDIDGLYFMEVVENRKRGIKRAKSANEPRWPNGAIFARLGVFFTRGGRPCPGNERVVACVHILRAYAIIVARRAVCGRHVELGCFIDESILSRSIK